MSRKRSDSSAAHVIAVTTVVAATMALACTSPSTITASDCDAWAAHYVDVSSNVASRCKDDDWMAIDATIRTRARDSYLASAKTKLAAECRKQVGRYYVTTDAQCFMSTSEYENWSKCNFETSFFGGFDGLREYNLCKRLLADAQATKNTPVPVETAATGPARAPSSTAPTVGTPSTSSTVTASSSTSVASTTPTQTPPANSAKLAAEDEGFVDTRGGAGWGDRCWVHLKANRLDAAQAACDQAMAMNPASPQPRASLLFNQGLIAEKRGDKATARRYFKESLALRPHRDVEAALARVGDE